MESLPVELLHHIHLLSESEHLPIANKSLHHIYQRTTSNRYRAIFLWRKYVTSNSNKIPWHAILSVPACTLEVLRILTSFHDQHQPGNKIKIPVLPTRLFKALNTSTKEEHTAYQYIHTLLKEYQTSPDKLGGYPLARSVLSRNIPFICLLLSYGARPAIKNNLVIMVAIETGDLSLLRLLIEPSFIHPRQDSSNHHSPLTLPQNSHKKIKLADRVQITDQMLEKAIKMKHPSIAHYLIQKGARPTLETIRLIESL
ncbi:hypothetical protein VP01_1125g4 [Puccinia sorghi]|uniref:Uncharacterized protein n=1 Tax=Puccinia sorghi TaxID=27349 RepID=A0A0L6VSA6_9BASI|nr:hypothetical protein VP01_1125g4 [Puccinia sorghi]